MRFSMRWIAAAIATAIAGRATQAQQTDIIRGRVTGPDSLPVTGVEVRATSATGSIVKTTSTDKNGRFTMIYLNGEGDYWLDFRKLGLAPRRFELKRIGDEEVLIADTRMTSTVAALDAVSVTAQRDRALPNRTSNPDVGGGEKPLTNSAAVAPDQAGNLAAMAAAVAGIQLIPGFDGAADMFTVLGLTGDQNSVTFNGLGSGISALPPDVLATTSITPYTFDPAIGGFSGAQIIIRTIPGSNFSRRSVSSVGIAPPLEWANTTAAAQGQKYTSARLGGNAAGPIVTDQLFYNAAYNVQRRFADARTLLNTAADGLSAAGVAPDSVARLRDILAQRSLPIAGGGGAGIDARDLIQGLMNFDFTPSASGTGNSFEVGGAGNYQRSKPVSTGGLLLATPSHAGESSLWGANVAGVHSAYFGFGVLTKTTLGFAASGTRIAPFVDLPEGSVRVSSDFPDGTASVKPLLFGGTSARSSQSNSTVQLTNQLSWFSANNRHTIKIGTSVQRDAFTSDAERGVLGSFTFNSLSDLESGRASSFTRTLSAPSQSGAQVLGSLSLGDYWRPSTGLQLQYGGRVDANRFLRSPAYNAAVLDATGLRNDVVPNDVYFSPRIGMQWYYGAAPTIAFAPGAARPPRAVIHAGIGVFQNMATSQLVAPAALATGLPTSATTLTCVGDAVPFPQWDSFLTDPSTIPSRCADGSSGSAFASSAPNVSLFSRDFRQARAVRAAADWSGPILDNRFVLGVQGIISGGLRQPGIVDVNFDPSTRFSLADEGGRPVYATPSSIVASTGSIAATASRRNPAFQKIGVEQSNLRVDARQLTVNLKPVTANPYLRWDLSYTLLDRYEKLNGFTTTAGDPRDVAWYPSQFGGRHTFALFWSNLPVRDLVYLTASVQVASGQRYTPMIAGDVNGDGYANDRAFIFDPAVPGPNGDALRTLLASGAPSARDCLAKQIGKLASRASCFGPWTAIGALQIKFNPEKIGLPKRLTAALTLQNPLAIADLALHGASDAHGWGQQIAPDATLLYVRGFDPTAQRFTYDVNQRFGSTRPQQSTTQAVPYLSLSFGLDIGMPRERQLLTQRLDMGRGRPGTKQTADAMKNLGTTTIPNPMNMIMQQQESLRLTRMQADSLATLSYRFSLFTDSVWTPAANSLAALPDAYDRGEAYGRYVKARERTVDYLLTLVPAAKAVLTPAQRRKLPPQISNYLDERVLHFLRSSTSGESGSVVR